ncbi:MAG: hypothetical protein GY941_04770 [Planctomycetes bacterium]|nr:hypothetical protein [Planctomycetota bacterium]
MHANQRLSLAIRERRLKVCQGQNRTWEIRPSGIAGRLTETWTKEKDNCRQSQWTESIAVGSERFTNAIKDKLGILAKGRKIIETGTEFQLREESTAYIGLSGGKNDDLEVKNTYYLGITH